MIRNNTMLSIPRPALLVGLAILAGCTVLPESEAVQLLDPQLSAPEATGEPVAWTLKVARPEADPARDSARVLVRTDQGQLQVHSSARWVAAAPELFRTQLLRYLRDGDMFAQVTAGAGGMDRTLALDLRRFELAESGADPLEADIRIEARLYDSRTSTLLARRLFQVRQVVDSAQPEQVLAGFEAALGEIIPSLAGWLRDHDGPGTSAR